MRKLIVSAIASLSVFLLLLAGAGTADAAAPSYHVVQPGQTLYSIATSYGLSSWSLARANGIWNPNLIYAGQVLVVPSAYSTVNSFNAPYYSRLPYAPRPTYGCLYNVQYGDTLSSIAARYGSDTSTIASLNGIANSNWIYAGQLLRIPGCN